MARSCTTAAHNASLDSNAAPSLPLTGAQVSERALASSDSRRWLGSRRRPPCRPPTLAVQAFAIAELAVRTFLPPAVHWCCLGGTPEALWGRSDVDGARLREYATYDANVLALGALSCTLPGRRGPGEGPVRAPPRCLRPSAIRLLPSLPPARPINSAFYLLHSPRWSLEVALK